MNKKGGLQIGSILKRGNMLFSLGMLAIVFILVLPLPTWVIDALLSLSIALAVLIIMLISSIKKPTDFSVFPTLLLFVTLFRLGLNIATTRAILTQGDAGNLISAFGQFVVQGNFVIGLVIFIILTIINFIVITKGAGRVAEVSARFTLDAMPGKQMSIDADLNAGIISEREARDRRRAIEREADFYGAMDGASKFVRGDAMAGVLITGINLIGGFVIGIVQMGLTAQESVQRFSLLSVGDGLVAQIPALLISAAAGILVTRSGSESGLGEEFLGQLLSNRRTVMMTGVMLWVLVLVPGFPEDRAHDHGRDLLRHLPPAAEPGGKGPRRWRPRRQRERQGRHRRGQGRQAGRTGRFHPQARRNSHARDRPRPAAARAGQHAEHARPRARAAPHPFPGNGRDDPAHHHPRPKLPRRAQIPAAAARPSPHPRRGVLQSAHGHGRRQRPGDAARPRDDRARLRHAGPLDPRDLAQGGRARRLRGHRPAHRHGHSPERDAEAPRRRHDHPPGRAGTAQPPQGNQRRRDHRARRAPDQHRPGPAHPAEPAEARASPSASSRSSSSVSATSIPTPRTSTS